MSWSISRVLFVLLRGNHSSGSDITASLKQSTRKQCGHTPIVSLFDLAPGGVYHAAFVTKVAVRSYRTISPLPSCEGGLFSAALAVGSRLPDVIRHLALLEPGLSSN